MITVDWNRESILAGKIVNFVRGLLTEGNCEFLPEAETDVSISKFPKVPFDAVSAAMCETCTISEGHCKGNICRDVFTFGKQLSGSVLTGLNDAFQFGSVRNSGVDRTDRHLVVHCQIHVDAAFSVAVSKGKESSEIIV